MIPIIISGGSGSRLWPISREQFPKQFCEILEQTLFSKTVQRLLPIKEPWVVTVHALKQLTERELSRNLVPISQCIYEPFANNTACAVALTLLHFSRLGLSEEVIGFFSADHLIEDEEGFRSAVMLAEKIALEGEVVTLGIKPDHPSSAFGYIKTSETIIGLGSGEYQPRRALKFVEKPTSEVASMFLQDGSYFWNAGMFIAKVSRLIELFKEHSPDIWEEVKKLNSNLSNLTEVYKKVRATSIDYAVMEKLKAHVCIPCSFGWSDLGSWDSYSQLNADQVKASRAVSIDSKNNSLISAIDKTYSFVGVDNLIVVDTPDALLVTQRGQTEKVKDVVAKLKSENNSSAVRHTFEHRPWGSFEILRDTATFKSKIITLDQGGQISYQSHDKRAEHWIIVRGKGEVVLDGAPLEVSTGSHVFIPIQAKHLIKNISVEPLQFVEIQLGSYFGEDDIVRYSDAYGRA